MLEAWQASSRKRVAEAFVVYLADATIALEMEVNNADAGRSSAS